MPYTSVTRAQLRGFLQDRLGPSAFWRNDELNRYLDESLRLWNALSGFWRQRVVVAGGGSVLFPAGTIANQVWYTRPATLVSIQKLEFNGLVMTPTSVPELDWGRPNWEGETTTSGGAVPTRPYMWAPAGLTLIAIWPADNAGGNALVADGIAQTPVPATDGAFVDIGREEVELVLDYAQHLSAFKEGGQEFVSSRRQFENFLKGAMERNGMLRTAKFRRYLGLEKDEETRPRRASTERVGVR